jgi:ribosomal-protein-alanine N-acetyltransferase
MEPKHLDDLLELELLSFSIPWTRKMFQEEFDNDKAFYFVACDGEKVVGYCGMWTIIDEGQITNIAVHPKMRNRGIAKQLILRLIEEASIQGIKALTLEVRRSNIQAINLYKWAGFYEDGFRKGYYIDNREDALIMWKKL